MQNPHQGISKREVAETDGLGGAVAVCIRSWQDECCTGRSCPLFTECYSSGKKEDKNTNAKGD